MTKITEVTYEEMHLLKMSRKVELKDMGQAMGEMLSGVGKDVGSKGIASAGQPLAIYHEFGSTYVVMDVGHPIKEKHDGDGDITYSTIPASKALKITHFRNYAELHLSYGKMSTHMEKNNIKNSGPPWEQYITDPTKVKDMSKWQTDIYFPI